MFKFLKVTGESLSPSYRTGDYVLLGTIPWIFVIKEGDTIAFHHPAYGMMIKNVSEVIDQGELFTVTGTHPRSVDSRTFGPVAKRDVIGKVLWHIPQQT